MTYKLGARVKATVTITASSVAVDPDDVTVTVLTPGEIETSYEYGTDVEVVKSGTGVYYVLIDGDETGTWFVRWTGTGTYKFAQEGEFEIDMSKFSE